MHTPIEIIPRNRRFEFARDLPVDWHSGDPAITHFFDALSLTFPEGERFFVDSVRRFSDRIEDPQLKTAVDAFIKQESIHAREHVRYNNLLTDHGLDVAAVDRLMKVALKWARKAPPKFQLAITAALEHFTALFAEVILADEKLMADAHPHYQDLWRWHAMEEQEHKAVAFDVYQTIAPGVGGYLRRIFAMTIIAFDFWLEVTLLQAYLMAKRGKFWNGKSWGRAFRFLFWSPGLWPRLYKGVFDYYRPSFHPWSRDPGVEFWEWRKYYGAKEFSGAAE